MARETFWNVIAKKYARDPVADQPSYERKLAMTQALLRPEMHLLEMGCGTGTTALYHAPKVAKIDALDFSKAMIGIARDKAASQGISNVDFRIGSFADLPATPQYDMALGLSLLHLLDDADAGVAALAGQVKPGGYVITSTVCMGDMTGLMPKVVPWIGKLGVIPKVLPVKRDDLIAAHRAAGLEIVDEFRPRPDASVFLIGQKPVMPV